MVPDIWQMGHLYTLHWHVRPFGQRPAARSNSSTAITVSDPSNFDAEVAVPFSGSQLYFIELTGVSYRFHACHAVLAWEGSRESKTKLQLSMEELPLRNISCE